LAGLCSFRYGLGEEFHELGITAARDQVSRSKAGMGCRGADLSLVKRE